MIPNISSPSFTSQANNNIYEESVYISTEERLEVLLWRASDITKMDEIPRINTVEDFHQAFLRLSRKGKHLFRVLQNWKYLECFPSQTLLAKMIKCSRKHVNHLLRILSKAGFIFKHYRHKETCMYMVRKFLKKVSWEDTKMALTNYAIPNRKNQKVTQEVIARDLNVYINVKNTNEKRKRSKKRRTRSKPPPTLPRWIPEIDVIREKFPELAQEMREDPTILTNLSAYNEHATNKALETLQHAIKKGWHIRTSYCRFLYGELNKFVEKEKRNWRLAMSLRKQEKT